MRRAKRGMLAIADATPLLGPAKLDPQQRVERRLRTLHTEATTITRPGAYGWRVLWEECGVLLRRRIDQYGRALHNPTETQPVIRKVRRVAYAAYHRAAYPPTPRRWGVVVSGLLRIERDLQGLPPLPSAQERRWVHATVAAIGTPSTLGSPSGPVAAEMATPSTSSPPRDILSDGPVVTPTMGSGNMAEKAETKKKAAKATKVPNEKGQRASKYGAERVAQVRKMHSEGKTAKAIAEELKMPPATVSGMIYRYTTYK